MVAIHLMPLVAMVARQMRVSAESMWPSGFGFLILIYLYLAGVSSLVEYGENMRFRLEVEPIIWAIALATLRVIWQLLHKIKPRRR